MYKKMKSSKCLKFEVSKVNVALALSFEIQTFLNIPLLRRLFR